MLNPSCVTLNEVKSLRVNFMKHLRAGSVKDPKRLVLSEVEGFFACGSE
jgi:hypothetical protein